MRKGRAAHGERNTENMARTTRPTKRFPACRIPFSLLLVPCFLLLLFLSACGDSQLDRLIQKADEEWIKGRNHSAIEILKSVLEKQAAGPTAEEALFRLGEINYFSLKSSSQALIYFQELLWLNKKSHFGYQAQKYIAEIVEFSVKDFDQAIIEYQKLINDFNHLSEEGTHQYRIASIYYKKQEYEQAMTELEILLENYPESSWAEESAYKIASILYTLNRCPESRQRYEWFVGKYPESKFLGEIEFVLASCLEEEGNLTEAYQRFKSLEGRYPYPALLKMKLEGIEIRVQKKPNKKGKSKHRRKVKSRKI